MSFVALGRRACAALIAVAVQVAAGTAASTQEQYPSSTVEVVVPFTAGGAVDVTGRVVAQALTKALGRSFVVMNRPGANSNIGNLFVARAKPDGYTLLVSSIGLAANKALYKDMQYDPLVGLAPVSLVSNAPLGLFVNKSLPVSNLKEFIDYLKENPGKLNYASYGLGSSPHLAAELFQTRDRHKNDPRALQRQRSGDGGDHFRHHTSHLLFPGRCIAFRPGWKSQADCVRR